MNEIKDRNPYMKTERHFIAQTVSRPFPHLIIEIGANLQKNAEEKRGGAGKLRKVGQKKEEKNKMGPTFCAFD